MKKLVGLLVLCFSFFYSQGQGSCGNGSYQFSDMVSIFQSNGCLGCHGNQGGLNLSNYQNVVTGGNNGMGGCGPYATALDFLLGKVDGSLNQLMGCGNPMPNGTPVGMPGMPPADLLALQTWIQSGAPEFCPTLSTCSGIDTNAGLPVIPVSVCSEDTVEICLTLVNPSEGLIITGTVDGVFTTLVGTPSVVPNQLCVSISAPVNSICAAVDVTINILTIQCTNGLDYPGILFGPTLVDDLNLAGQNPIDIPVFPVLYPLMLASVPCGTIDAVLLVENGGNCPLGPGSTFTCTSNSDVFSYDFTPFITANFPGIPPSCIQGPLMQSASCTGCPMACPTVLNLNANPENTGLYEADDLVISTSTVNAQSLGPVRYTAGDDGIILNSDFYADGTVDFDAKIIDCDPTN